MNDVADAAADADIDYEDHFDGPKKKLSGKKIVLFFVLPILLLAGSGAGIVMSGLLDGEATDKKAPHAAQPEEMRTVFYDLPEMLVNLNSTGRRLNYLKIQVSLELTSDVAVEKLKVLSPRIVDNFQVYLRELRVEDLRGSAGIYRLREELLARVNSAVRPTKVKDVLFKEMLVQ
ncbi:MAG: flagellar FliL protein [Alphaproteobacteria bacterium]